MGFNQNFAEHGVQVDHVFLPGQYTKVCRIPSGLKLTQHSHLFDHGSILVSGSVMVEVDGVGELMTGPAGRVIEAGKAHSVTALTDVVWLCQHQTDETDPDRIDGSLVA